MNKIIAGCGSLSYLYKIHAPAIWTLVPRGTLLHQDLHKNAYHRPLSRNASQRARMYWNPTVKYVKLTSFFPLAYFIKIVAK